MNIDWFTFAAQIVNFLLLVALLRWLLYDRILQAMRQREEKIANRLQEAEQKQKDAENKIEEYKGKVRHIEEQREDVLQEARRQAQNEHDQLLKDAREEADRRREQWRQAYRREREELVSDLRRRAGEMGVEAARRTLSQLADADLEQKICDRFIERLQDLDEEQRKEIADHLGDGEAPASIHTTFALSEKRQNRLGEVIREVFGETADVRFERDSDLICGIEFDIGGYRFGWNVKNFLRDLDSEFHRRLKAAE